MHILTIKSVVRESDINMCQFGAHSNFSDDIIIYTLFKVMVFTQVTTFESARLRALNFCVDRQWEKFHTPFNLVLALSGECGELDEIFQWKGPLDDGINDSFNEKDLIHIGEEIADVFIYSTRLADQCGIDLAYCSKFCAEMMTTCDILNAADFASYHFDAKSKSNYVQWEDFAFEHLDSMISQQFITKTKSPRILALSIQSRCGRICELFQTKSETLSIESWSQNDFNEVAIQLGSICVLLSRMANVSKTNLGNCISDKFTKNEAKYPVALAKGSSAKYTAYVDVIKASQNNKSNVSKIIDSTNNNSPVFIITISCILSGLCGYFIGKLGTN